MSVTTSARLNYDQLAAVIGVPGCLSVAGADLPSTATKVISHSAVDDATLQAAITAAAGQFVDRTANQQTILSWLDTEAQTVHTWIANNPTGAILTGPQTLKLMQGLERLILLARQNFTTPGTGT